MNRNHLHIALLFCCIVLISSCKRDLTPIGPAYKVPTSNFTLTADLKADLSTVNFSVDPIEKQFFTASFSEEVSWILTLTGLNSGAEKKFRGLSNKLDVSNTEWTGKHDVLYFFRTEDVVASLSFVGSDLLFTDTFHIEYPRKWDVLGKVVTVLDFETAPGSTKFLYTFFDGTPHRYPTYKSTDSLGSDMISGANNRIQSVIRDIDGGIITSERKGSIEGDKLYRMAGHDGVYSGDGASANFIGGAGMPKAPFYALDSNPENVYFNIYVYGTGDKNSKLVVNFAEDDDDDDLIATSGLMADNYVPLEDEYEFGIQVDWVGWKLVSGKYSGFPLTTDGAKARNGNKKREPHHIGKIGVVLLATTKGEKSCVNFDFATFTMGKPFNPQD
jgi:hypothetical protein